MENRDELIRQYKQRYGDDAPIPPDHLLERIATGKAQEDYDSLDEEQKRQTKALIDNVLNSVTRPDGSLPKDLMDKNNTMWEDMEGGD